MLFCIPDFISWIVEGHLVQGVFVTTQVKSEILKSFKMLLTSTALCPDFDHLVSVQPISYYICTDRRHFRLISSFEMCNQVKATFSQTAEIWKISKQRLCNYNFYQVQA